MSDTSNFKKVLKKLDMTLFTVCAILVIDTLTPAASIGVSSLTWWMIMLVFFFIPYGLITAELGAAYPEQGGLYIWVKNAFGNRWAARSTWYYWVNVALWMPSVYIMFAGVFSQLFFPGLSMFMQICIGIIMTWLTVWMGIVSLDTGKWIPNIGAFLKVFIMSFIGIAGIVYAFKNGSANTFTLKALVPEMNEGLKFLPAILFSFMGFELMSGAGDEMENPGRDIPKAIIESGVLIAIFYLLGTLGILLALPVEQIGLIDGFIDTLRLFLGSGSSGNVLVFLLGIGILYTFFANVVTWNMGANRTAAEAAEEGELPGILGKLHPVNRTPVNAFIFTGIISTLVIILYGFFAQTAEDLFWSLFAFSSIIFLLPYLAIFPAFLKLRIADPDRPRPYRLPGKPWVGRLLSALCFLFILQAIILFVWIPGESMDPMFTISVISGVVVIILIGEILISLAGKRRIS